MKVWVVRMGVELCVWPDDDEEEESWTSVRCLAMEDVEEDGGAEGTGPVRVSMESSGTVFERARG